jgi:hypothetical protein
MKYHRPSSVVATDPSAGIAATVAAEVLGTRVETAERLIIAGRNSRIYRIRSGDRTFALKQYPRLREDPRDRLQAEMEALRLMERYGIEAVPRVVGANRQEGFLLLTWIDGTPVNAANEEDLNAADKFLTGLHALRNKAEAQCLAPAAEACLSCAEIERQILARLSRLDMRAASEPELAAFLDQSFRAALNRLLPHVLSRMLAAGSAYSVPLQMGLRTLIPADFGFHNSLRQSDGRLAFLDFEYFGWDDPVKLTADFLLHPGMTLDSIGRINFRKAAERRYADDYNFPARLDALLPLFGLRWVLVLLNEFLPERWEIRVQAGNKGEWTEVKARQLARARSLLDWISQELQES